MPNRIDDEYKALGGTGLQHISTLRRQRYQAQGATSENVNDAEAEALDDEPSPHRNDKRFSFLGNLGFLGALVDRLAAYWRTF